MAVSSLPPGVEGPVQGQLELSLGPVVFLRPEEQSHSLQVRVQWWGSVHSGCIVPATGGVLQYDVVSSASRFQRYLQDMECLTLRLEPLPCRHQLQPLGAASLNLYELVAGRFLSVMAPVMCREGYALLGHVPVEASLKVGPPGNAEGDEAEPNRGHAASSMHRPLGLDSHCPFQQILSAMTRDGTGSEDVLGVDALLQRCAKRRDGHELPPMELSYLRMMLGNIPGGATAACGLLTTAIAECAAAEETAQGFWEGESPHPFAAGLAAALLAQQFAVQSAMENGKNLGRNSAIHLADLGMAVISVVPDATLAELRHLLACLRGMQGDSIEVAELWSSLARLSGHAASRRLLDTDRDDFGAQVPTASILQPDAAQMPKVTPQSWQATPVRPQKQAKRSRSQLLASQTLQDHVNDSPRSPASSTPKPKSPLRRAPRQKADALQQAATRQLPRSVQEPPRMTPHEQGPASPKPRTVIPRPRSPVRVEREGRPDRKRSRSPVLRSRADRTAGRCPGISIGSGAVEPAKNRVLGNDTSFWPGGVHAWPDAPMIGHHVFPYPEPLLAATNASAEAVSKEQQGPSVDPDLSGSFFHQEQRQPEAGLQSDLGASGNPFGAFTNGEPCLVDATSHTITDNPVGNPFVGQRFPGMPFVPLAPMGIPSPKMGEPPQPLELVVGYPQVSTSQTGFCMERLALAEELWQSKGAPSQGWPLGRKSDASVLVLQSLLARAEELHMDMHHALQAHGQLRLEQRLAGTVEKRDAGTTPSPDIGRSLANSAAPRSSGKENQGGDGGMLERNPFAEGAWPPSSSCRPSLPYLRRSPSLSAPHAATSCMPLLPAGLDASEDEDEEALLAEILTASSAYINPQATSAQHEGATAGHADSTEQGPPAFSQASSNSPAELASGHISFQPSLSESLPDRAARTQTSTITVVNQDEAVGNTQEGAKYALSWSGWPGLHDAVLVNTDGASDSRPEAASGEAVARGVDSNDEAKDVFKVQGPASAEAEGSLQIPGAGPSNSFAQGQHSNPQQIEKQPLNIRISNRLSSDHPEAIEETPLGTLAEALPMSKEQIGKQHSEKDSPAPAAVPTQDLLHVLEVSIISATGLHARGNLPAHLPQPHACYLAYRYPGEPAPLRTQPMEVGRDGEVAFGVRAQHEAVLPGERALAEGDSDSDFAQLHFEVWQQWAEGPDTLFATAVLPVSAIATLPRTGNPADSSAASFSQHLCRLALEPMWWRSEEGDLHNQGGNKADENQAVSSSAADVRLDQPALLLEVRYTVLPAAVEAVEQTADASGALQETAAADNACMKQEAKMSALRLQVLQACGLGTAVRAAAEMLDSGSSLLSRALQRGPNVFVQVLLPSALCGSGSGQAVMASPVVPSSVSPELQLDRELRLKLDAATLRVLASEEVQIELWHSCAARSSPPSSKVAPADVQEVFLGGAAMQLSSLLTKPQGLSEWLPIQSRQGKPVGAVQMSAFFTELAGKPYHASPASRPPLDLLLKHDENIPNSVRHLRAAGFDRQPAALTINLGACGLPEGAEPGLGGAKYKILYRLPGTMEMVETESMAAVQQGGRGNTRTPSWRLEVQHSHTTWARADSLLAQALLGYPLLLTVLRSSTARSAASKGSAERPAAVASASVDLSPLLHHLREGADAADLRHISVNALIVQPGAKYLSGATASLTVTLDLWPSSPPAALLRQPQWHMQRFEPASQAQANVMSSESPLEEAESPSEKAESPSGNANCTSEKENHECEEEDLSLAFELRSLGYTPALLATSSGVQQPEGTNAAGEGSSQSQSADDSGASASHSAAASLPPANSSNADLAGEPPGTIVDESRDVLEGEEHRLRVHIDSALHLTFAASYGDVQQRALYVTYTWESGGLHASPLALAEGDSKGGEASARWRYSANHPCAEDAAASSDITFQICARRVMGGTLDAIQQAQPQPGDTVVGVAMVEMSALARLGEICGWYNVLDEASRTVGQLKVAVSLPGRSQKPPAQEPALHQPSLVQPSQREGDSEPTAALGSNNDVSLGAFGLEADRRLDELPPGWRAAGVLQQRDSDSTVDLKAALRSNLQELDVMMTHIKPPLPPTDASSPSTVSGSPTHNTAAVVDTFAGLSLYPQSGGGFSEHLGLPEAGSSFTADASQAEAGAEADRWDSIEQELWVDPGILSIIGDSHPLPSSGNGKASDLHTAERVEVAHEPEYSVSDESFFRELQPNSLSAAACESQNTVPSHLEEGPATHETMLDQAALHYPFAAGYTHGSVPGYSSFSDYVFGIGVLDAPYPDVLPDLSAGDVTQRESGGLSCADVGQTKQIGRSPGYGNFGIGSEGGQEGGQLLTLSDDENYMVIGDLAGGSNSDSGSDVDGHAADTTATAKIVVNGSTFRGFDHAALSFGDHADSAWLFDISKPSEDPSNAQPAAQLDADRSPARTEGIAPESSQAEDSQPTGSNGVDGEHSSSGRQQEMTQPSTAKKEAGAGMQELSSGTNANGDVFEGENGASQVALHPLLAAVPVVAKGSVTSKPEPLPQDAPLTLPDTERPHPLLTFDPFAATPSDVFAPPAQEQPHCNLQTFGPPEFAAELDFLVPVLPERPMTSPASGRYGRRKRLASGLLPSVSRSAEDLRLPRRSTPPLPPSSRSVADLSELRLGRTSPRDLRHAAAVRPPKPSKQALPGAQDFPRMQADPQAAVKKRAGESSSLPAGNGRVPGEAAASTAHELTVNQGTEASAAVGAEPGKGSSPERAAEMAAQARAEASEAHEATSSDTGHSREQQTEAIDDTEEDRVLSDRRADSWPQAKSKASLNGRIFDVIMVGRSEEVPLVSPFEASLGSSESPWENSLLGPLHIVAQSVQSSHDSSQSASPEEGASRLPAVLSEEGGFRMSPDVSDGSNARLTSLLSNTSTQSAPPAITLTETIDNRACAPAQGGSRGRGRADATATLGCCWTVRG